MFGCNAAREVFSRHVMPAYRNIYERKRSGMVEMFPDLDNRVEEGPKRTDIMHNVELPQNSEKNT